jgi:aspartyl-tRNA(Asn)/glutamyl-tRNA(Gln) amidotransferase subunit A
MSFEIAKLTAQDLGAEYRAKSLSPVEATRAALDHIERLNGVVNAFCLVDRDRALVDAKASEDRFQRGEPLGPLDGVTATIKDLLISKDWPTLRGSRSIDPNQPWPDDAPSVARLREQGVVFLGKTTTPEFGWKGVTDSALCGITRNPWDVTKTPGGSSGGAAVAAALCMGALHLGTDGGGSIRIPAAFTGVVGIKPTFGRVPAYPASPFGDVAHVGPITRSVKDAASMLEAIGKPDSRDWLALPFAPPSYLSGIDAGVSGLRIALCTHLGGASAVPEVETAVAKAAQSFERLGATVEEADPGLPAMQKLFRTLWFSGAASLAATLAPAVRETLDPGLQTVMAEGEKISHLDYMAALRERAAIGITLSRFFDAFDLLLTPALPLAAFEAGREFPGNAEGRRWTDWAPFSYPFNLSQQPAIVVPCGQTLSGLPIGLQIVGPRLSEGLLFRAAYAFEAVHGVPLPPMASEQGAVSA